MNIVVIGGGSAGRTAAIEAASIGENVTLIEMDKIGGKCLNTGCMVVCGLNDVARFIKDAQIFNQNGIINTKLKIDFEKVSEGITSTIKKIRGVLSSETIKAGVNIVYGVAEVKEGHVVVDGEKYPYDKLIIATGSYAFIPSIKGVENAKLYKDVLDYKEIPKKLVIIGSGTIATEFAGIFSALGSKVYILSRGSFLKKIDPDIKEYIVKKLLKEVEIYENLSVKEIYSDGVLTKLGRIDGDVLLAVGMVPNSEIVKDLVEIGENSEIVVNKMMETSHPNIYAAGDVVGSIGTTPVARMEGVVAARNACGISAKVDYKYIPSSISLYYDVSYINSNEKGFTGYIPGSAGPGAFWNVLNSETGITKASVDIENGDIKGVSSIAPSARTILAYISKFMRDNKKIYDFEDFIESHPSTDSVYKLMRYFSKYQ